MLNTAQRIPFHIADHSLNFFAKGRGFTVGNDNANFDELRRMLANGIHDVEKLALLADPRVAVAAASNGLCQVVGNSVIYEGAPLHNVWVDKILSFQKHDLPFEPIMLALSDLQKNPTEKARFRLPVFVEQSKLGFLPDGRIVALKGVNDNYTDCHTGRFDNKVGQVLEMTREKVDNDPDMECSSGFHLGAYDYVKNYYGGVGRRIMLCAFWPRDVVAVPRDYNGQKMRVCKYEVIDEMDKTKLLQFIEENQSLLRSYEVRMPAENRLDAAIERVEDDYDDTAPGPLDGDEEDQDDEIEAEEEWEAEKALAAEDVGSVIQSADQTMTVDTAAKTITVSDKPKRAYKKRAPVKKAKPKKAVAKKKVVAKKPAKKVAKVVAKKATKKAAPKKKPVLKKKRK